MFNTPAKTPVTVRVAQWSAEHPWRAIGIWFVFVVLCVGAGSIVGTNDGKPSDFGVGESGRGTKTIEEAGLANPVTENVLITARSGSLNLTTAHKAATEVSNRLRTLSEVGQVGEVIQAKDRSALLVPITMRSDSDTADDQVPALLKETAKVQQSYREMRIEQIGDASVTHGINERVGKDLQKSEILSLPITLIILVIVFGALIAAGAPVLLALSAVAAAIGLSAIASQVFPDSGTTSNVILLMGLAVGVDYSLFYLKREREERKKGRSHLQAVEVAAATSGHSVVISAAAVIVSAAGLYIINEATFNSLATAMILVVAVAMIGSLTVLPAFLAKLGRWVDRPRIPFLWRLTNRSGESRLWPVLLRPALRHPALTALVSIAALVMLALPVLSLNLKTTGIDELPNDLPVKQAYQRMTKAFPSENLTHQIVVKAAPEQAGQVHDALENITKKASADKYFTVDQSAPIRISKDSRVSTVELTTAYADSTREAENSLRELRNNIIPQNLNISGAEYAVTGIIAENADYTKQLRQKLPLIIGFVLLLTFIMIAVTFRSIVAALTAITVNLLSALAAFGVLVLVFQHHWAQGLLGFESTGTVSAWVPMFLFVILFGLSMDYHVFLVNRIREAVLGGMPTREAIGYGISKSAGVVTSAAVVMVAVFAVFATLSLVEMKEIGVGLAIAILIDAVIIRIVVLPSLMTLLGSANWWPAAIARNEKKAQVTEHSEPKVPELATQ